MTAPLSTIPPRDVPLMLPMLDPPPAPLAPVLDPLVPDPLGTTTGPGPSGIVVAGATGAVVVVVAFEYATEEVELNSSPESELDDRIS